MKDLFGDDGPSPLGGRPRVDVRACLEGIHWIPKTGAPWKYLPDRCPSPCTCCRRHRDWTEFGLIVKAWERLLKRMDCRQLLSWSQAMGDGTFSPAKSSACRRTRRTRTLTLVQPKGKRHQADANDRRPGYLHLGTVC
ncbi:transposase [Thalassoglobus sp. JC818]|uniref:transposase n=1 Tax=Thalassoglobus sp. JC818 TaxID=3232136 RepID=UPI00345959D2